MSVQAKSSVWCYGEDVMTSWCVAETPSEVEHIVEEAIENGKRFAVLTLANPTTGTDSGSWNGRPLRVAASSVIGIAPPLSDMREEDE